MIINFQNLFVYKGTKGEYVNGKFIIEMFLYGENCTLLLCSNNFIWLFQ